MKYVSEAGEMLKLSESELDTAREMYRKDIDEKKAWTTIYYSLYYSAKAALLSRDMEPKTHKGVNRQVGRKFYKENEIITKEQASFYSEMRRLREELDYDPYAILPDREIEDAFQTAENFIQRMKQTIDTEER